MTEAIFVMYGRIEARADQYFVSSGVAKSIDSASLVRVDDSQAWFWTPEWQARYQLAILELNAGNYVEFDNGDDFVASLNDL